MLFRGYSFSDKLISAAIFDQSHSSVFKVVHIIKRTCTVFINNFRNISIDSSIYVSVCSGSYDGYVKHKRNNPTCDPWDSQGNEKNAISISIAFSINILIRNITSEDHKTKNRLK